MPFACARFEPAMEQGQKLIHLPSHPPCSASLCLCHLSLGWTWQPAARPTCGGCSFASSKHIHTCFYTCTCTSLVLCNDDDGSHDVDARGRRRRRRGRGGKDPRFAVGEARRRRVRATCERDVRCATTESEVVACALARRAEAHVRTDRDTRRLVVVEREDDEERQVPQPRSARARRCDTEAADIVCDDVDGRGR